MKGLGISGSPRKGGNTETLLDAFLAGVEEAGAETPQGGTPPPRYRLCKGGKACPKTRESGFEDDPPPPPLGGPAGGTIAPPPPRPSLGGAPRTTALTP
ncbi:NAD(P)H-dependent oxidoreductase, partial [Methanocalculus sp.]|uniref:NAD(P)H-dependent oxidoreductase n=1 Tax=Methanocalculus sp. TaxID=2004547 RepID=UPI0034589FFF